MIDPTEELQVVIVAAVKAVDPPVKIYDEPPATASYPYVSLTGISILPSEEDPACGEFCTAVVTFHLVSDEPGTRAGRRLGKALIPAIDVEFQMPGYRVIGPPDVVAKYQPSPEPDVPVQGEITATYEIQAR